MQLFLPLLLLLKGADSMGVFQRYVKEDRDGNTILGKDGKPMRTGPWFIQYPHTRDPETGKVKYRTEKASHSKKVAEQMLRAKEDEFLKAEKLGFQVPVDMNFSELMDWGLSQEVMQAKSSCNDDRSRTEHLKAHFGRTKATQITPLMVDNFRVRMMQTVSDKTGKAFSGTTVNKMVSLARRVYYLAMDAGIVSSNPFARRGLYKEQPVGRYIPDQEFRAILGHLPDYMKPVALTAYYTGMRSGEVISLVWERVDLFKGIIDLTSKDTKTGEPRHIYFGVIPELRDIFVALAKRRRAKSQVVFLDPQGKPLTNWLVGSCFRDCSLKAGVGPYRFHDLRHTFNSNMLRAGVEQAVIMRLTGHKTVSMFLRYSHVNHEQAQEAMAKMRGSMPGGE